MLSYLRLIILPISLTLIMLLSACSTVSMKNSPIDESLPLRDQLQILVNDAVDSGFPGVSLHVQDGDEHINIVAGVVNQATNEPVTDSSLFQVASAGKPFVATMILRLVDQGLLQLDDTIDKWLDPSMSAMIDNSNKITLEMLLAHSSGIRDYFDIPRYGDALADSPGKIWKPIEVIWYINNTKNHFEPGAKYRYSNTNYVLLGVIAERVTNLPLGTALRKWVFEPAELENTFGAYENLGQAEIAHGYLEASIFKNSGLNVVLPADGSDLDTFEWLRVVGLGDAPIHSTPYDLNSFIRTLIDTETLVSGDLKRKMLTESFPGKSEYGFGISITDKGTSFDHSGKQFGLFSVMAYSSSENLSFATTINSSFGTYDELFKQYLVRLYSILERG